MWVASPVDASSWWNIGGDIEELMHGDATLCGGRDLRQSVFLMRCAWWFYFSSGFQRFTRLLTVASRGYLIFTFPFPSLFMFFIYCYGVVERFLTNGDVGWGRCRRHMQFVGVMWCQIWFCACVDEDLEAAILLLLFCFLDVRFLSGYVFLAGLYCYDRGRKWLLVCSWCIIDFAGSTCYWCYDLLHFFTL